MKATNLKIREKKVHLQKIKHLFKKPSPARERKVILNLRDQSILVSLFKNKILALKQVHRCFFKTSTINAASMRMSKLCRSGFIEKKSIFLNNSNQTYFEISPKGIDFIKHQLGGDVAFKNYKSDSLIHDLHLVDISNVFQSFSCVSNVFYESEIRSYSHESLDDELSSFLALRSDRVLELKVTGSEGVLVALEYERTLKRFHRLVQKLKDYYLHEDIPAVFYICENKKNIKELIKADEKACDGERSKVYFCELEDVKRSHERVAFINKENKKMVFK